ncbi:MAG: sigma factor-like helix-turn-helix DNA-binding protein [Acidaminococcaceae bacterium]
MPQRIEEIYKDKKYDKVVYYFKEKGIMTAEDLVTFDFNELMFVPGLSDELIYEARKVFQYFDGEAETNSWKLLEKKLFNDNSKENYMEADKIENIEGLSDKKTNTSQQYFINESMNIAEKDFTAGIECMPVEEFFYNMPNGDILIGYCHKYEIRTIGMLRSFVPEVSELFQFFLVMSKLRWHFKNINQSIKNGIDAEKIFQSIHTDGSKYFSAESEVIISSDIEDIPVEEIFGSMQSGEVLISYCRKHKIENMNTLKNHISDVHRFLKMVLVSFEKVKMNLKAINRQFEDMKSYMALNDVPKVNDELSLNVLKCAGISEENVKTLNERGFHTISDLGNSKLVPQNYALIIDAVPFINRPVDAIFTKKFDDLKEIARKCLIQRSQGITLQEIADEVGLTRERVRQIAAKACRNLASNSRMIAAILLKNSNNCFSSVDLKRLFSDQTTADCCKYVLVEFVKVPYLSFCDKFISETLCPENLDSVLQRFANSFIGNGINFYDNLEYIEDELTKYDLGFLNFEDIMNYLLKNGYHFYGDYVLKAGTSYTDIFHDAIMKYFTFDIKLDQNEDNEDMEKLRKIIGEHYSGFKLPENNRAFTAVITRDPRIVLAGRGRYCPVEKAMYSSNLLEEVYLYIRNSKQTSFYYTELFESFRGRFLAETNISNYNFLHGILKYLYPYDFNYERDLLVKNGAVRQNTDERICNLIIENKGALGKVEIQRAFQGIKDYIITFVIERNPKLIQWEYGVYNHVDNILCDVKDREKLRWILTNYLKINNGYISESMLFNAVKLEYPYFITKNKIKNSMNLFYVISYFFSGEYRFKRPHVGSNDLPVSELSGVNIARLFLGIKTIVSYKAYMDLAKSLGWPESTQNMIFAEIEKDFFRISQDDYVLFDSVSFSDAFLQETRKQIAYFVGTSGYCAINNIFSFNSFPEGSFKWNGFLLESIIEKCAIGFKMLQPQVRDRRYQRGIIVSNDSPQSTFEDLVLYLMKSDGVKVLNEVELQVYLKNKGLILNQLPQELYECSKLSYKNGQFTLII